MNQVETFRALFGESAPVTLANCRKAVAAGLSLAWAAYNLMGPTAREAYQKALATAQGLRANHAAVRLHRARAALRQKLRAHRGADALADCVDCTCAEHRCGT